VESAAVVALWHHDEHPGWIAVPEIALVIVPMLGRQARLGLAFVLCGAVIVVDNMPDHDGSELVFVPVMFRIAWAAGYTLRERARHACCNSPLSCADNVHYVKLARTAPRPPPGSPRQSLSCLHRRWSSLTQSGAIRCLSH
jgi:hypothetical protein